jgi:CRP/FNR family transcriptional regulator
LKLEPSAFIADPELIQALEYQATCTTCREDQTLFHQGDAPSGLYILCQGEATLTMTSATGETVTSLQAQSGSLLGLPGLIGDEPYTLTAVARPGSKFCFIDRESFTSLMKANPQLSLKILQVLAAEVRAARRALADL